MVGSPFILINKNGSRNLLNVSQIVMASDEDIRLTEENRKYRYEAFPPEQEMIYTIDLVLVGGKGFAFMYSSKEERDTVLDQLLTAISPTLTLDSPAGLPITWPEWARREPMQESKLKKEYKAGEKLYTKEEVFCTYDEFQRATAKVLEEKEKEWAQRYHPAPSAPTKPPRKPYTRKPRE